ncbi:MAG: choice-of-anchor Q domain-containing protein [Acidobacteriota bacterium]
MMQRTGKRIIRKAGLIFALSAMTMWTGMSLSAGTMRTATASNGAKPSSSRATASPMATITVTNTYDSGAGSLRQAITDAAAGDTIDFSVTGTITLTTGELTIDKDLIITGPGAMSLTVSGNNASRVFNIASGVTATISSLTISNGSASGVGGGILNAGTLTIQNSTLSGNSASSGGSGGDGGGGIRNNGTLTITNSTLSGNSAAATNGGGGGIRNDGTVTIQNSTLSGNSAGSFGGGIFNNGTTTIQNSTLSGNSASSNGGGIFNSGGTANIKNSIVADSTSGGDCGGAGSFNTSGGANFSTDSSCPGFNQVPSTGMGGLNLGPLQNNGGPTFTHALLTGSVAIDAATDCTDFDDNPIFTDQRGIARPIDGDGDFGPLCDAGAYEAPLCTNGVDTFAPLITCPSNLTAKAPKPGSATVVVTYPPPMAEDNCSLQSVVCTPPSGSAFPLGSTTVTCTATDTSGNTASCSFTISTFDVCTQDDTNSRTVLLWNSQTGDYLFCCAGFIFTGRGVAARQGNVFTLSHNAFNRRVLARVDAGLSKGTASLQSPVGVSRCSITDRDIRNNSCLCP